MMALGQTLNFSVTFAGQAPRAAADKRMILCCSKGKWHKNFKIMVVTVGFQFFFFFFLILASTFQILASSLP